MIRRGIAVAWIKLLGGFIMFKFSKIHFYNWETGERISPWIGFPLCFLFLACFVTLIWLFILFGYEVRDYLQNKPKNNNPQPYCGNVSFEPISASCIHARDGIPVFVIVDTHFKAFVKDKGTSNDVKDKARSV